MGLRYKVGDRLKGDGGVVLTVIETRSPVSENDVAYRLEWTSSRDGKPLRLWYFADSVHEMTPVKEEQVAMEESPVVEVGQRWKWSRFNADRIPDPWAERAAKSAALLAKTRWRTGDCDE